MTRDFLTTVTPLYTDNAPCVGDSHTDLKEGNKWKMSHCLGLFKS